MQVGARFCNVVNLPALSVMENLNPTDTVRLEAHCKTSSYIQAYSAQLDTAPPTDFVVHESKFGQDGRTIGLAQNARVW